MRNHGLKTGLLAGFAAGAALAAHAALAETTLERINSEGVVSAAFADETPYGFVDDAGQLTGVSPEVARHVLERIGVAKMDGVLTEFGSLIPGLNARRWDLVAAGMFITPKRCQEADFSRPTYVMGQSFLVEKGNPHDLHSYKDVADNANITLGVLAGAVEAGYAEKAGIADGQIKQLPDQASMLAAVRAKRVDAAALTSPSIVRMAQRGGEGVEAVADFDTPPYATGYGGLVFRQDDDAFRQAVNKKLDAFIGSDAHLQLIKPFGFTRANIPAQGVTTQELCNGEQGDQLTDK